MTVFIAEDEPSLRALLVELLGQLTEIEIVGQTGDVEKAQELIASLNPDAVLLDLGLNGGTGWSVLKHVKTTMPLVIVIVMSGKDDPSIEAKCQILGADYFFRKGEGFDTLIQVVSRLKPQGTRERSPGHDDRKSKQEPTPYRNYATQTNVR